MNETNNTRQAAWIAVGSLFSFGFGIVSSMILSRYFDKGDYGTYKQVMYVYTTLLTVFTLGLPKAYSFFLPRVDINEARNLIKKITFLFLILGASFSLSLFFGSSIISTILNNKDLDDALKIFAPVPFFMLPTMGLEGILATYKKTQYMAIYTIMTRVIMLSFVAVPVLLFNLGYKEAIMGFVLASFLDFLMALYLRNLPLKNCGNETTTISYKDILKFSLPLLYASLWGTIIVSSDQFFISRYFGNEVFAEFSNGFMELPFVGMIIGACATVLSPVFSRLSSGNVDPIKEVYPIWMSVFKKTAMLIYPLIIYCWVFADVVMVVLYGSKYESSDIYFRIKLITNFFTLIMYGPLIINIGKVKEYSNIHMYNAIILVIIEYISIKLFSSPYVLASISVICTIGKIYFLLRIVSNYFGMKIRYMFPVKLVLKILIPSFIILLVEYFLLVNTLSLEYIYVLFISFPCYLIIYLVYAKIVKLDYSALIIPLFKH